MKKKLLRSFRRQKKSVINKSKFLTQHPLVVPVTSFVVLFLAGLVMFVALGASTQGASDARIVNVYVDGEQQTVTTRARDIEDLLKRLDIDIEEEDLVEPKVTEPILEDNTQVNIYRARPVELVDGDRVITILTAQRAPKLIAADAGLDLYPEDEAIVDESDRNVLESGVSERLVIDRSVEIKLSVYGVLKELRTTADTMGELLEKEGIVPEEGDGLQPGAAARIKKDELYAVNRPGVETEAVEEVIPFETERESDDSLAVGQTKVEKKGVNGSRAVVYEVKKDEEGKVLSRKEIQKVVTKKPKTQVIVVGTKVVAPSLNPSTEVSGDKASLMAAAGISKNDYAFVDFIVTKESRWRPGVANAYSGAYGLCQAYPASKMSSAGSDWRTNPVTQLKWCSGYANGRYGSWSGAYSAWQAQGWW